MKGKEGRTPSIRKVSGVDGGEGVEVVEVNQHLQKSEGTEGECSHGGLVLWWEGWGWEGVRVRKERGGVSVVRRESGGRRVAGAASMHGT